MLFVVQAYAHKETVRLFKEGASDGKTDAACDKAPYADPVAVTQVKWVKVEGAWFLFICSQQGFQVVDGTGKRSLQFFNTSTLGSHPDGEQQLSSRALAGTLVSNVAMQMSCRRAVVLLLCPARPVCALVATTARSWCGRCQKSRRSRSHRRSRVTATASILWLRRETGWCLATEVASSSSGVRHRLRSTASSTSALGTRSLPLAFTATTPSWVIRRATYGCSPSRRESSPWRSPLTRDASLRSTSTLRALP